MHAFKGTQPPRVSYGGHGGSANPAASSCAGVGTLCQERGATAGTAGHVGRWYLVVLNGKWCDWVLQPPGDRVILDADAWGSFVKVLT